ncbi:MAG: zinc metalloprotease HtpX [Deltaproteobacteria bacterium]|nr:zinc metalloprotease HtpX [Deltaproteobacteria bacterium]MBI3754882.1 zinc metalloprotease HtpX [Deltaproteobacteria bacterium]
MNFLKTTVLLAVLTAILVFAGDALGGRNGAMMALVFAGIMNFGAYWFSDKIVLMMYGAKEVSEADAPELYAITRDLTMKAGLPMPKVYIMENDTPNAFATGRNPLHAAVAATAGIMRLLTREELSGVIGHELAHIQNRDILISTIAATIAGAISYLAHMAQWAAMFGSSRDDERGGNPIALIVMMIVAPLAAMIIQMAISRSREYGADEGGARITGNPLSLANALRKLEYANKRIPMDVPNEATAHMFIVSPLSGGTLLRLFSTHPPIEERIKRLEAMGGGPRY